MVSSSSDSPLKLRMERLCQKQSTLWLAAFQTPKCSIAQLSPDRKAVVVITKIDATLLHRSSDGDNGEQEEFADTIRRR